VRSLHNTESLYNARPYTDYRAGITAMTEGVILRTEAALGHITLNRPNALNALTQEMCASIYEALWDWAQNDAVHAVLIDAVPGRAFCAGGDIRSIYHLGRQDPAQAEAFFATEYRLNAAVRHFPKPYLALLNGITMGGGAGLSVHGSHRIATENASFAMPETGIGLYPDVGGSFFLSRLPGETGTYLALAGVRIGPADMLSLGLATHFVPSDTMDQLAPRLAQGETADAAIRELTQVIAEVAPLAEHRQEIDGFFSGSCVEAIIAKLQTGTLWARGAAQTLASRSPTSLKLTLKALREAKKLEFDGCMRMEYRLTLRVLRGHDLYEGVRALLIDRDQKPHWEPDSLAGVADEQIDAYFAPLGKKELVLGR
jgi:enoyl-CoA hydratase